MRLRRRMVELLLLLLLWRGRSYPLEQVEGEGEKAV
jgi:hypothetical protein